jgi:hypothetical protein
VHVKTVVSLVLELIKRCFDKIVLDQSGQRVSQLLSNVLFDENIFKRLQQVVETLRTATNQKASDWVEDGLTEL